MEFDTERLRPAEWLLAAVSLLLLVDLLTLPWFGLTATFAPTAHSLGQPTQTTGWAGLLLLGPVALLAGLGGLACWFLQAVRRGPALPVALTSLTEALAIVLLLGLIVRVLLAPPSVLVPGAGGVPAIQSEYGGYIGLLLSAVMLFACWWSLRTVRAAELDEPEQIELLNLAQRSGPKN